VARPLGNTGALQLHGGRKSPLGLDTAVLVAKDLVGNEPFAVLLGDVIILVRGPRRGNWVEVYEATGKKVLSPSKEVPRERTRLYGIVDVEPANVSRWGETALRKFATWSRNRARRGRLPNLGVTGRYVLQPEVFDCLERRSTPARGARYN